MTNRNNDDWARKTSREDASNSNNGNIRVDSGAWGGEMTIPLQNRVAHLLFTAMYLGTALWMVIHG